MRFSNLPEVSGLGRLGPEPLLYCPSSVPALLLSLPLLLSLFWGSCCFDLFLVFFPFNSYCKKIQCFVRQKLFEAILRPLDLWSESVNGWQSYVSVQPCIHTRLSVGGWLALSLGWPTVVRLAWRWAQPHRWLWHSAFEKFISVGVSGA